MRENSGNNRASAERIVPSQTPASISVPGSLLKHYSINTYLSKASPDPTCRRKFSKLLPVKVACSPGQAAARPSLSYF